MMSIEQYFREIAIDTDTFDFDDNVASVNACVTMICVWESGKTNAWKKTLPTEEGYYLTNGYLDDEKDNCFVMIRDFSFIHQWWDDAYTVVEWLPIPKIDFLSVYNTIMQII